MVASGNALPTGRILFAEERAVFAGEGQHFAILEREPDIDSALVVPASGHKHAPLIVHVLLERDLAPYLVTCDAGAPAARLLPAERVIETRSNPEPITYNTSTYMGMILARTREDPARIRRHLGEVVRPLLPDFNRYEAFYLMVLPEFEAEVPIFVTKFDELFGGRVNGRCYTTEQTLHAKTVVPWEEELFLSFGFENRTSAWRAFTSPCPRAPASPP